ncbi:antiviral RADAR system adenosine deaminase RdrB [Aeromonas enteropelogenes]|uniref:antiviral RADAR system adenosine deaminase RdrB n=1 Tax=Aeromonas enteropelogenes TaxID=29489 RepID=UPI003B9E9133
MLQRTLTEHAAECFFGDQRLAGWLWDTLLTPSDALESDRWHQLQDDFYHLLVEGVEARYPREHRLTDVRQLMGRMLDGHLLLTPALPWLNELQQRLLQRNGDLLCYREGEVRAYVRLAAGIDPTLLAGWHLAQWLDEMPQPQANDIRRVVSAQTAFFAPPGNPSLPFAEGHVHFWGVTADSAILDDYLLAGQLLNLDGKASLWQREQHGNLQLLLQHARQLLVLLLEPCRPEDWPQQLKRLNLAMTKPIRNPDWELLADSQSAATLGSADWLLGEFALSMGRSNSNRWLWLHVYLCRRYSEQDSHPLQRAAILWFWQTVNQLRRSLIMDGQGLTRFAERYFGSALERKPKRHDNMRRLWSGACDVAEIKSKPAAFSTSFTRPFAKAMAKNAGLSQPKPTYIFGEHEIRPDGKTQAYLQNLERWQFCGHFSRSQPHKQNQPPKPGSKQLWQEAETLMRNLHSASGWNAPEFLGGKLNPNFHFQPARWFRGLDVAGDENALKIEWFAPALRWLRSGLKPRPDGERAGTGFHLSIHAGEDYAHPASGMRHIDETVRFCEMREGDRLGHALALGIVPKQWTTRQGEMLLPLDEHLDNLVWLWHHASVLSGVLSLAQQVLPLFERRIMRFWRLSRWWQVPDWMVEDDHGCNGKAAVAQVANFEIAPLRHATPNDLYQAWWLRRNCHYRLSKVSDGWPVTSQELCALPDYQELSERRTLSSQLYQARHDWLASLTEAPLVIVRMGDEAASHAGFHPKLGRKADENILEDVDTPAELDFMHALQDWLLTEYDKLGLIIEANPTSNVYIARLKSHAEHPIFRWYPPDESALESGAAANLYGLRRGPVRVLVNTDDPGIMPTTLRTEFLLLREAALELKIGRTVAERWLETLRQYGIEQFHRNHLPVFEPV